MEQRISLITLGVQDLKRARGFYRKLGWREIEPAMDEIAFFQLPGLALALWPEGALAEDAQMAPRAGRGFGGATVAINVADPAEVDAVLAEAERAGASILKMAEKTFWGGYSGYFADPEGHPWEVSHNPFCFVAPDGASLFGEAAKAALAAAAAS